MHRDPECKSKFIPLYVSCIDSPFTNLFPVSDSYVLQYNGDDSVVYMYPEKRSRTLHDHIAINFKTLEQDGLLLHSEGIQGDLFTLELKKGRLYLHMSLGTAQVTCTPPPPPIEILLRTW